MSQIIYKCQFCGAYQKTGSTNLDSIIKCAHCSRQMCKKCNKYSFCPECRNVISDDDNKELQKLQSIAKTAEFKANTGCWGLMLGIILIIAHFIEPSNYLLYVGIAVIVIAIVILKTMWKPSSIADENLNKKIYEVKKKMQ